MKDFKNSTRMQYMTDTGGVFNERGKRATLAEMEAEDRRMGSSMPAKKPVGPSSVAVSKVLSGMAKKALPAKMMNSEREVGMVRRNKGGLMAMPKGKCK